MAVKKNVKGMRENFIGRGADVKSDKNKIFTNVLIRIPGVILEELDDLLEEKPWLNRTQWIVEAINDKLKRDE